MRGGDRGWSPAWVRHVACAGLLGALLAGCASVRPLGAVDAPVPGIAADVPFAFVVMGDNRPQFSRTKDRVKAKMEEMLFPQSTTYREIVKEANALHPAFVVNTGDLILGYTHGLGDRRLARKILRKEFEAFREATSVLTVPFYAAPGNHDTKDQESVEEYRRAISPRLHYSFNYGNSHFVFLDSAQKEHRIDPDQVDWFTEDLERVSGRVGHIFVFLHEPLFPVLAPTKEHPFHGHVGSSLDKFPEERDRLHALLVKYKVTAVIAGHEHLYSRQEKDGIVYVISGGAGGDVYTELGEAGGGYPHYLVVSVRGAEVMYEVRRPGPWQP